MSEVMLPLQSSWDFRALEGELKELFMKLYADTMQPVADDINVYGAPHLGSFGLIEKSVEIDGISVLRQTSEDRLRYLFKAWRYQNPDRGLHFLRTYIRCVWGDGQNTDQLWQKKTSPYPTELRTASEIASRGESESDYYLTSRVRVDLDTDLVPDRIIRSLRSSVPARFLLNMRVAKFGIREVSMAVASRGSVIVRVAGDLESVSGINMKAGSKFGAVTVVYGQSD